MKNITLSAKNESIARAREVANQRKSTLNALFPEWLADLVRQQDRETKLRDLGVSSWAMRIPAAARKSLSKNISRLGSASIPWKSKTFSKN
jgi:hypothetical protein